MPMTCVAYGCYNHFFQGCGKQFFRFPMKDPERLSLWVVAIRRKGWKPSASSRICSDHFTDKDYMLRPGAMVPRLRLDAVPSIFNGFPKHLKDHLERKKKKIDTKEVVISTDQVCLVKEEPNTSVSCEESDLVSGLATDSSLPSTTPSITQGEENKIMKACLVKEELISNSEESGLSTDSSPTTPSLTQGQENQIVTEKIKIKYGPLETSPPKTCAVYGCNNTLVKGCGKRFFRFPLRNPKQLLRWIQALQITDWTPATSHIICSDHFKDRDYIVRPGSDAPQLRANSVPSVFKAKRRKSLKPEPMCEKEGPTRKLDHTYSAVQNAIDVPPPKSDNIEMKKKVRALQRQIQRQRHTIKKLSERIALLRENKVVENQIYYIFNRDFFNRDTFCHD